MSTSFSLTGIARMRRRVGLVFLIYGVGLTISVLIGAAILKLLGTTIGPSGFSQHLAERFDLVLWFDFWKELGPGLAAIMRQVFLAGAILMVWKVISQVGLIHALQSESNRNFWDGVTQFSGRGLLLGLLFLAVLLPLLAAVVGICLAVAQPMGEVGKFWMWIVVTPLAVVFLTAVFDLFQDYARIHLVLRDMTVRKSWIAGIKWPFQHFRAILLYKLWFFLSVGLWLAVLILGFYLPDQTISALLLGFLVQQVLIIARTGASVSWTGAQVAFFEDKAPPILAVEVGLDPDVDPITSPE